jgi:hypothetical protein
MLLLWYPELQNALLRGGEMPLLRAQKSELEKYLENRVDFWIEFVI